MAENCLVGAERLIPLYVDLGRFKRGMFYDHALMNARENGLEEENFKELLYAGKLSIFLDGLDLLGGSEYFEPVAEIQNFMSEFSRCKFVLSSRPGFFEGFKSSCKVSELVELNNTKIMEYIHKYLGYGDEADTLINRIFDRSIFSIFEDRIFHGNEQLKSLCRNPMMLRLVIWLQKDDKMADDRAEIYRESIEGIITHYLAKGKTLSSNEQFVKDVLKELAFSVQKENAVSLGYGSALDVAGSCTSPKRYGEINSKQVLDDCFELGFLHKDGGKLGFGFHQSFQEYFAAVKLKEIFEHGYDISESFSHPKWEDTLVFLSEIVERPDELFDDAIDAGEVFLAAKLTARVDDRRVENLCARLLDRVDSRFDLEKDLAVESFTYIGNRSVEALMELLISEDEVILPKVAEALGKIRDETVVGLLINLLQKDNDDIKSWALYVLEKIGDEKAVEQLVDVLLHDKNTGLRDQAADALESTKSKTAVELLIDALHNGDVEAREWAAYTLGGFVDKRVFEPLINALHDEYAVVRYWAIVALGRTGDKRAVEPMALP